MLRVVMALAVAALGLGCKSSIRTYEGQICSVNDGDDPHFACARGENLICISTYDIPVTHPQEMRKWDGGVRPVWLCRIPCETAGASCGSEGGVCCPGTVYGSKLSAGLACVLKAFCADLPASHGDGGRRRGDAGVLDGAAPDASQDAPAADGGVDAAMDAALDADPVDA